MNNLNKNYEDLSFQDFTIRLFKAEKEYEANSGVAPITIKSSGYLQSFDLCYMQISDAGLAPHPQGLAKTQRSCSGGPD